MQFLIKEDKLLKKCDKIQNEIKNSRKEQFDSEAIYNKNFLKNKTKAYDAEAVAFMTNKFVRQALIIPTYIFQILPKIEKNVLTLYPKMLLKECRYIERLDILQRHQKFFC